MIRKEFLPLSRPNITKLELEKVNEVIKSGWLTTGPVVSEFEKQLSNYLQKDERLYTVGLNSCTSALHLALIALGIKPGDEIIVPTWTFVSTAHVVEWIGAKPVLCDIEEETLNIDVEKVRKLVNSKTKAIIPVHIAGYPCEMEKISEFAVEFNLFVIEDAAHAIGTEYKGVKIGNFSDVTCFSFYATKNLAMGEGGAAVSKDSELIEKIRKLSYFGINKEAFKRYSKAGTWRYDIEELGYKNNLDSVHAALGLAQLERLDEMNERRRKIAELYNESLTDRVIRPYDNSINYHIYHLYPVRIEGKYNNRDVLMEKLKERNIGTSVHFIPLHMHSHYKNNFNLDDFSSSNSAFEKILSIPMFPSMSEDDVDYVSKNINEILKY